MRRKTVSFYMDEELRKYMTPTAKKYLLCSWYRYMFKFIPFRSGIMASLMDFPKDETVRNEVKISPEAALQTALATIKSDPKNVIRFKAPYALRQYHGESFNFTHDLHPNACAKWAEVAADLYGEKIIKEYANFVERTMRSFAYI